MAELVNDRSPHTLDLLGELATYVETTRTALLLAEEHAVENEAGFWFPHERPLHPMRSLLSAWFTRAHDILMTVGSHNLLAAPSRAMLDDVELRPLVDRYLRGAHDAPAEERAAVYRLAWDFVGSGLGARSELYERNYLRSRRSNQMAYHDVYADRSLPDQLVDHFIER
jgi:aromatic ring hydroxylase